MSKQEKKAAALMANEVILKNLVPLRRSSALMDMSVQQKGSQFWLELCNTLIRDSEVAALLGLDEHTSRKRLLEVKAGLRDREKPGDVSSRMMDFGSIAKASALRRCQDLMPFPIVDVGRLRLIADPTLQGTPDGVAIRGDHWFPIEIKTRVYPNPFDAKPYETKFDVPYKHWIRLLVYMMMLDATESLLCSYTYDHGVKFYLMRFRRTFVWNHIVKCLEGFRTGTLSSHATAAERESLNEAMMEVVMEDVKPMDDAQLKVHMRSCQAGFC